jgi:tryptophan synthase alpha chain
MSKRLNDLIKDKAGKDEKLLSIFITAGFPEIDSTKEIILALDEAGVDFIELGIPFSDPIADGPVIQKASERAIHNIDQASASSVDGLIIPDWALEENQKYSDILKKHDLDIIHLLAPNTPPDRIKIINEVSSSFIYCVAYTGVTGQDNKPTEKTSDFLKTIRKKLNHPLMIGFGIKNREDYLTYTNYADGVIIGSAFIRLLEKTNREERREAIDRFIKQIR